jgi:anti-sigma-K factor RskA
VVAQLAPKGAKAQLVVRDGESTLQTRGMPSPGRGRVYQVWLKRHGQAAPQPTDALFGVSHDGSGSTAVSGDLADVDAVLVTSEPAGGSRAPTRQPVLSFSPA